MDSQARRGAPQARNLELALMMLVIVGGLPAVAVSLWFLWRGDLAAEVRWTFTVLVLTGWLAAGSAE